MVAVASGILVVLVSILVYRATLPPPGMPLAKRILGKAPYRPVILGFYENDSSPGAGDGSWASLVSNARYIDLVAPYWYRIGNGGIVVRDMHDPKVVAFASRHNIRVWPLVGNDGYGMITTPASRRTTIHTLVKLARLRHYDGIFVDFELLPSSEQADFSTFIRDLSAALHRLNLGLGVAVFPKVGVTPDVQGVYDYPTLGRFADAMIVMAYDHHQNTSPPGAVAPLGWVRANMVYAMSQVPRPKLFLGVGQYGYDWTAPGSATTLSTRAVEALLAERRMLPLWSRTQQEPHFRYQDSQGRQHDVWYEDTFTFRQKLALSRSLRLGGISLWRLGYEEPSMWRALAQEERGLSPKPLPPVVHPKSQKLG